jgi:hypothetical protein
MKGGEFFGELAETEEEGVGFREGFGTGDFVFGV